MLQNLTTKILPRPIVERIREYRFRQALPEEARKVEAEDLKGLPEHDPGPEEAIRLGLFQRLEHPAFRLERSALLDPVGGKQA